MHPVIANRRRRLFAWPIGAIAAGLLMGACGTEAKHESTTSSVVPSSEATPPTETPEASPASAAPDAEPAVPIDAVQTIALADEAPVPVPGSEMSAHISGSFHKSRAPLVGVSVLLSLGEQKAEVSWRIESGQIDSSWRPLEGRRFDDATNAYVEESIPGWVVRLDSVEDHSAGGDPTAITISLKRMP